jgi:hypothetical protein
MSELDEATLRKLSRTEMIRVLDEFRSARDAAERAAMRAFDERNLALADTRRIDWLEQHAGVYVWDRSSQGEIGKTWLTAPPSLRMNIDNAMLAEERAK